MRNLWIGLFCLLSSVCQAQYQRLSVSHDGNFHDRDDIGASSWGLGLLINAGVSNRLVHFDFNCHFPDNNPSQANAMRVSCLTPPQYFPFNCGFYDCQQDRFGAINDLAAQINSSGPGNELLILEAGPAEIIWQAYNKSSPNVRKYTHILTHSTWNDTHKHTGTHNLQDIQNSFGPIDVIRIPDQNTNLNTRGNWSPWFWARDSKNQYIRWLYLRMQAAGKPDISDSGMYYYAIYGDPTPTPNDYRIKFHQ